MYLDVILAENDAVAYTSCLQPHKRLISSLTVKPGVLLVSSPSVSQSVRLSVRLSVHSVSVRSIFKTFLSRHLRC